MFWTSLGMSISTGPGPAGAGQVKRLLDDPRDVLGVLDQVMVLGDRPGDLHHRRFLERVGADHVPRNLAGDGDQRHRVHLGVGQPGHQVERTGAGGRHHHARLAAGPGIALGREDPPLLVPRQDRPDPVAVARQRLVHRHARPAGIGEDDLDAVPHQRLDQNVRPGDRLRCGLGHGLAIVDGGHGESSLRGDCRVRLDWLFFKADLFYNVCLLANNWTGDRRADFLDAVPPDGQIRTPPGSNPTGLPSAERAHALKIRMRGTSTTQT